MTEETATGAAPAAEPTPAPAEASQTTAEPTGGAAPGAAPELTPYQRRKQREAEKRQAAEARKAKRAAKGTAAEKKPAATPAAATPAEDDDRDDAQRARETGGAWRLVLRIVGLVLWPFGWRLEQLTDRECAEDVALLLPLARRHRWLDLCVRYAALPYLLVERIVTKAKRREPAQDAGKGKAS